MKEYLPITTKSVFCPAQDKLLEGTRGGAKTTTLLADYERYVGCGFGEKYKGILFRTEFRELQEIKARAKEMFCGSKWQAIPVGNAPMIVKFPSGENLTITIMKDQKQENLLVGQEYPWIGYDEVTMVANQEVYTNLIGANRTTLPIPSRLTSTCNPWGIGRDWVKKLFKIGETPDSTIFTNEYGRAACHIFSSIFDNPYLLNSVDGVNYLKALARLPEEKKQAWLYGNWNFVVGGFLESCWSTKKQVVEPFIIPKKWYAFRSFDWGYSSPFAVGYYVVSDGSSYLNSQKELTRTTAGDVFKIFEIYGAKYKDKTSSQKTGIEMSNPDIAKKIKECDEFLLSELDVKFQTGPADSQIFAEKNNNNIAKQFKSEGISFVSADKSSRVNSASILIDMLDEAKLDNFEKTKPCFKIWDNCVETIRTLPTLKRCDIKLEDISQKPKQEDHLYDETRYALTFASQPSNIKIVSNFTF